MSSEEVFLLGLLNGIASHQFFGRKSFESAKLRQDFYPDLPDDEFLLLRERMSQLLRSMASSDMDFSQLEAFLTSQTKRRESNRLTEGQAKVLVKFWKSHKSRIHDALITESSFNPTLKSFKWRIDVPTHTKDGSHANTPVAILEMTLREDGGRSEEKLDTCQFEMDEKESAKLRNTLDDINLRLSVFGEQ